MAGGVITTGSHPKALWPGVRAFWGQVYDGNPTEYTDLSEVDDSQQAYEEDVQITRFGLAEVKPEGDGISYDYEIQGPVQRYLHIAYALGYKVTYEELKDNLYETVSMRRAQANAFSMAQTVENLGAAVYNDAFTGAVFQYATGTNLCSASQVNTTGGTFSNLLTPGAPIQETSLEDACIQLMGTQSDRGLLVSVMPQSLIVPRQQWFNANRILGSVLQAETANNSLNVLKATNAFPQGIKMNHYLSSANAWFIRTNCPNGMRMFWRERPSLDRDNDFDTRNAKASSYMRLSFGATDPRGILGCQGP